MGFGQSSREEKEIMKRKHEISEQMHDLVNTFTRLERNIRNIQDEYCTDFSYYIEIKDPNSNKNLGTMSYGTIKGGKKK